ncbi:MAG: hypothetical protein L3J82_09755 [Planctomycetes bacterium]|nr:hypothetical protein [Planctomycetota bacterium]
MNHSNAKLYSKVSHLVLGAALVFALSACGSSQDTSHQEGPSTYDSVYDDWDSKGKRKKPADADNSILKKPAESPQNTDTSSATPAVEKPAESVATKKPTVPPEPKPASATAEPKTLEEIKSRFVEETNSAIDAEMAYYNAKNEGLKTDEAYVNMAVHMYSALALRNRYINLGGNSNILPKLRILKEMKGDFKTALGPSNDPRVKAAIKKWQETTN